MELTLLMPCLNEEKTIKTVIEKSFKFLNDNKVKGEVLVVDNGSNDDSIKLIKSTNARLISVAEKGYGSALIEGIKNAKGKYIIMYDSDDTYDLNDLNLLYSNLKDGNDLVIGNRYKGGFEKGSMKISHFIGVKFLTYLANFLYHTKIGDYHCGLRGFNKDKILKLNLECIGMEFASEIIIKSKLKKYKIIEIPTKLFKDKRGYKSHLNTIRDGIRHLKCILKYRFKKHFT